jgi:hypothetical protein
MSLPYKRMKTPCTLYILLFLKISGPKLVSKFCLEFPVLEKNLLMYLNTFTLGIHIDFDIDIDIFVNCNWVGTRCQYTFTHKNT